MKITCAYAVMVGLAPMAKGGAVRDRWRMCEIMVVGRRLRHAGVRLQAIILIDRSTERAELDLRARFALCRQRRIHDESGAGRDSCDNSRAGPPVRCRGRRRAIANPKTQEARNVSALQRGTTASNVRGTQRTRGWADVIGARVKIRRLCGPWTAAGCLVASF
jgi:hypothetical protein